MELRACWVRFVDFETYPEFAAVRFAGGVLSGVVCWMRRRVVQLVACLLQVGCGFVVDHGFIPPFPMLLYTPAECGAAVTFMPETTRSGSV